MALFRFSEYLTFVNNYIEHRHAGPDTEGFERHTRAEDHLPARREYRTHAAPRDGARHRGDAGGRCLGHLQRRPGAADRLAPARHGAHGRGSAAFGRQRLGPQPRREEPVHHRRQRVRDLGRRQSDADHTGRGAVRRR